MYICTVYSTVQCRRSSCGVFHPSDRFHLSLLTSDCLAYVLRKRPPPQRQLVRIYVGSTPALLFKAGFRTYRVISSTSKARRLARGSRLKIKPGDAGSLVLSLRASCHWTTSISECSFKLSCRFDFSILCNKHCNVLIQVLRNQTRMLSTPGILLDCSCASLHFLFYLNCMFDSCFLTISAGQAFEQNHEQEGGSCDGSFAIYGGTSVLPTFGSIRSRRSSSSFWCSGASDDACLPTQLLLTSDRPVPSRWFFLQGPLWPSPFFPFWRQGLLPSRTCIAISLPCQASCIVMLSSLDSDESFHRILDRKHLVSQFLHDCYPFWVFLSFCSLKFCFPFSGCDSSLFCWDVVKRSSFFGRVRLGFSRLELGECPSRDLHCLLLRSSICSTILHVFPHLISFDGDCPCKCCNPQGFYFFDALLSVTKIIGGVDDEIYPLGSSFSSFSSEANGMPHSSHHLSCTSFDFKGPYMDTGNLPQVYASYPSSQPKREGNASYPDEESGNLDSAGPASGSLDDHQSASLALSSSSGNESWGSPIAHEDSFEFSFKERCDTPRKRKTVFDSGAYKHPELSPLARYNKHKRKLRFHAPSHEDVDMSFTPEEYAPGWCEVGREGWERTLVERSQRLWETEQRRSVSISSISSVESLRPNAISTPPYIGNDPDASDCTLSFSVHLDDGSQGASSRVFAQPLKPYVGTIDLDGSGEGSGSDLSVNGGSLPIVGDVHSWFFDEFGLLGRKHCPSHMCRDAVAADFQQGWAYLPRHSFIIFDPPAELCDQKGTGVFNCGSDGSVSLSGGIPRDNPYAGPWRVHVYFYDDQGYKGLREYDPGVPHAAIFQDFLRGWAYTPKFHSRVIAHACPDFFRHVPLADVAIIWVVLLSATNLSHRGPLCLIDDSFLHDDAISESSFRACWFHAFRISDIAIKWVLDIPRFLRGFFVFTLIDGNAYNPNAMVNGDPIFISFGSVISFSLHNDYGLAIAIGTMQPFRRTVSDNAAFEISFYDQRNLYGGPDYERICARRNRTRFGHDSVGAITYALSAGFLGDAPCCFQTEGYIFGGGGSFCCP